MAASYRTFRLMLYQEYLEEASFLYEQRNKLYGSREITWTKIGEFEDRLEAQIDGLVLGDTLAIESCKKRASEADFGELFAIVCVYCRQDRRDLVWETLERIDPADTLKREALSTALKYEFPENWSPDFLLALTMGDLRYSPILARALGYRRLSCGPQLMVALKKCATAVIPALVWALGRVRYEPSRDLLFDLLRSEEESIRSASAIALVRMGDHRAVEYCLEAGASSSWPLLPLGIAAGQRALGLLTERVRQGGDADSILALGLLGECESIPLLISCLELPDQAPTAAVSLECLTGAGLYEAVFVPDDALDGESSEFAQDPENPDRGDGRPFGSTVARLSQNPADWQLWWSSSRSQFTPGRRYRNGGLHSPRRLIEMLASEKTPQELRQYCFDELAATYRQDFGLETDMPVRSQRGLLGRATDWAELHSHHFHEGFWYFNGLLCE